MKLTKLGLNPLDIKATDDCGNEVRGTRMINIVQKLFAGRYIEIAESGDSATISADISADYYDKTQINQIIADLDTVKFRVVATLPPLGVANVIYLVEKTAPDTGYNQYIWNDTESQFEPIGDTDIDLSDYYTKTQSDDKFQEKLTAGDPIETISDSTSLSQVLLGSKTVKQTTGVAIWNYIKSKFTGTAVSPIDDSTRISGVDFTKADPNQYMTAYDLYAYGIEKIGSEFVSTMTDSTAVADFQPGAATQVKRVTGSTIWNYIKSKMVGAISSVITSDLGTSKAMATTSDGKIVATLVTRDELYTLRGSDTSTTLQAQIDEMWKKIYPVGAVYISMNSTSPATLFGGTWTQITDRFLLAVGSTYTTANSTGGSSTMTITRANLPRVSITTTSAGKKTFDLDGVKGFTYKSGGTANKWGFDYGTHEMYEKKSYGSSEETASDHTHSFNLNGNVTQTATNNMPPYLTVYMWRRTA